MAFKRSGVGARGGFGSRFPNPAFGVASRPRSVPFPEGLRDRHWEESPLREMTSAAYGFAGRLDLRGAPQVLPGMAFFATTPLFEVLLDEESHIWHAPLERGTPNF